MNQNCTPSLNFYGHCYSLLSNVFHSLRLLGRVVLFSLLLSICTISTVFAQDSIEYVPQMVIIQFESDTVNKTTKTGLQEFDRRASRYQVYETERAFPALDHVTPTPKIQHNLMALRRTYYVRYRANISPEQVARDLHQAPGVTYCEPVAVNYMQVIDSNQEYEQGIDNPNSTHIVDPNDPWFRSEPGQTELHRLRLPEAWDIVKSEKAESKVVIAVVDGGSEWRHEDLRENVWTNKDEIPGNGIDDDNNEYIDDVHGINLADNNARNNDPTGLPSTPVSARHGTHVAGFSGAVTNNGIGMAGTAWNADMMYVNIACEHVDEAVCMGYPGILYAAINGADIINVSWGQNWSYLRFKLPRQILDLATDLGALIVAAAGNSAKSQDNVISYHYPTMHPRVLSVGSTEKDTRRLAHFSNYGRLVNVYAPGIALITTGPGDEYFILQGGTSFSAPLVAGIAALVKTQHPDWTPDMVREHVRLTSENMDAENPSHAGELGHGYVNALAAVQKEPSVPAIRLARWKWTDRDGDPEISPGDEVTITAVLVNHLSSARQLRVGLTGSEPYPFLNWTIREVNVGTLLKEDSVRVEFQFSLPNTAPLGQNILLFTHIQEGEFEDQPDMIPFWINQPIAEVHQNLSALYTATGGDSWHKKDRWNTEKIPTKDELRLWHGVDYQRGGLSKLHLQENNLQGSLPPEIGNLLELTELQLQGNSLSGPLPRNILQLKNLILFNFKDQELCAPQDSEFEAWLKSIPLPVQGHICLGVLFTDEVNDQSYPLGTPIQPLVLPAAATGVPPITYTLSPALPQGLHFDASTRTVRGTPTEITPPVSFTYTATDVEENKDQLTFDIRVFPSISIETLRSALRALYVSTDGKNWTNKTGWDFTTPPTLEDLANWYGVRIAQGQLNALTLQENNLVGMIPPELGQIAGLTELNLSSNFLSGPVPDELGDLSQLVRLYLNDTSLMGPLPQSLMQLNKLTTFFFDNANLCAPKDNEFQAWLNTISDIRGPICSVVTFSEELTDYSYAHAKPIEELVFPEPATGKAPFTYTLTPELPQGLSFQAETRTLSGTPTVITRPVLMTYTATDRYGFQSSLQFYLRVFQPDPIDVLHEALSALYTSAGGPNWNQNSGWSPSTLPTDQELENWYGVTLSQGQVQALDLQYNNLIGAIAPELSQLSELQQLSLYGNSLAGRIPPELGQLSQLRFLWLNDNDLVGSIPTEFGNLSQLQSLYLGKNTLSGSLPRSFLKLQNLKNLTFSGQGLCAPQDDEFQSWLSSLLQIEGPTCTGVSFAGEVADQSYLHAQPVESLMLPETSGTPPIIYTLSLPLPQGLTFDPETRIIRGTPTQVQPPTLFTYTATDADGASASLKFSIEVVSPVAAESESLPDELIVHANYPNPFRQTTRMVFDLPRPARIHIEVMDILGRHVYTNPPVDLAAGWGQEVELNSISLPAGHYLYRLTADMAKTQSVHVGQFVRTQ